MFKRRRYKHVAVAVGILLALGVVLRLGGAAILGSYGKTKVERAFNRAHPGLVLRLGGLHFALWSNRMSTERVSLSSTNRTIEAGSCSLTGVRWYKLWRDPAAWPKALANAELEANDVTADFPAGRYRLRCGRFQASVPGSNAVVERFELRPRMDDDGFFAANPYRGPRFRVVASQGMMIGLELPALLEGAAFRAQSILFENPRLEVLLNREKPVEPLVKRPPMLPEALAAVPLPLEIGTIQLTNGFLDYEERFAAGAEPARLTMTSFEMSARGVRNSGGETKPMRIEARTQLMNAGTLKVAMSIPLDTPNFSFHYSGSLGPMDLRSLNPFLEISDQTRVRSGRVQEAAFDIEVRSGHAIGQVQGRYRDLKIDVLASNAMSDHQLRSKFSTFVANAVKIRNANPSPVLNRMKSGRVEYRREDDDEFVEFVWQALRTGVLDIINH